MRDAYQASLGGTWDVQNAAAGDDGAGTVHPSPGALGGSMVAVVAAVVVCVSVALLAVAGVLLYHRKHLRRTLLGGRVLAPGPGPATTVVVAEAAHLERLREGLPAHVVDAALALQLESFRCVRACLAAEGWRRRRGRPP